MEERTRGVVTEALRTEVDFAFEIEIDKGIAAPVAAGVLQTMKESEIKVDL